MFKFTLFLGVVLLTSCSSTRSIAIDLPEDEKQRSFTINLSLSTQNLYNAYMSSDVNQRRFAEMYVAGVLDSLEGVTWCGYDVASPDAIQEQVYLGLRETLKINPNIRASVAIQSKLEKLLPCKEQK